MSTRSFGSLGAASAVGITAGAAATALILRRLLLRTRLPRLRAHYCVTNLDEQRRRILEEAAPNVDITFGLEVGALKKHADPVVVVLPGAAGPQMELACATLPGLKHIIVPYAGILPPQLERLRGAFGDRLDTTVTLHNLHHNAPMTAEMGVALLLAAAKRIVPADRRLRAGDWRPRGLPFDGAVVEPPMPMLLLEGRCALVLGLGNLGGRIAKVLLALGMRVVGTRRSARRKRMVDGVEVHPTSGLAALLPRAGARSCGSNPLLGSKLLLLC
jgi:phosphoglycerate dehydrogenase-like enzyme|eukprot:Transcript_475.p3 GENE.Transcript_475~~Transcript_475.p3  ORF type:complete len:273 (-),score=65.94 Transcript_475:527-1345(-)